MLISKLSDLKDQPVCITLGSFDGLHLGHKLLLDKLKTISEEKRCLSLVISFYPHPRKIISSDYNLNLLITQSEKVSLLKKYGIDLVYFINFSNEIAEMGHKEFYENFIFDNINVQHIVIGDDHSFGKDRGGNKDTLKHLCERRSIGLTTVSPAIIDNKPISSTRIREYISSGDVKNASKLLGYNYSIESIVTKGRGNGRSLGFPTANLNLDGIEKSLPAEGVYVTRSYFNGNIEFSLTSIGNNPTLGKSEVSVENHIPGINENLYGKDLRIEFLDRIRDIIRFESDTDLKNAITNDLKSLRNLI